MACIDYLYPDARLIIFAKAPQAGKVKTRLARRVGNRTAVAAYKVLLSNTVLTAEEANVCPVEIHCSPGVAHPFFKSFQRRYSLELRAQRPGNLGQRMHKAMSESLKTSSAVVIIGADCGSLSANLLRTAMDTLHQETEAVIAPAEDGGYVLIGLSRAEGKLFRGIAWGGSNVEKVTRRRLQLSNLSWKRLPVQWDVDNFIDWKRYRRNHEH